MPPAQLPFTNHTSGLQPQLFEALLRSNTFKMPLQQADSDYFPEFLAAKLNTYADHFEKELLDKVDGRHFDKTSPTLALSYIRILSSGLIKAVEEYYAGNVLAATETFNTALDTVQFMNTASISEIKPGNNFYRARVSNKKSLTRPELFHNPYENRHLVATSRYSIPGFPALYLGNSIFATWRELEEPPLNSLYVSRLTNKAPVKVVEILAAFQMQQFSHVYSAYPNHHSTTVIHESGRTNKFLNFLASYPVSIACSIRIKQNGTFKPEYIIPQLLLQYIVKKNIENDTLIGIMYHSTKFNFIVPNSQISANYVFPVKEIAKAGYCPKLLNAFDITQPTSIDMEELLNHSIHRLPIPPASGDIELLPGEYTPYVKTKFFYIENIINNKPLAPVI